MIRKLKIFIKINILNLISFYTIKIDGIIRVININKLNLIFFTNDSLVEVRRKRFLSLSDIIEYEIDVYIKNNLLGMINYDDFNIQIISLINFDSDLGFRQENHQLFSYAIDYNNNNYNSYSIFINETLKNLYKDIEKYQIINIDSLSIKIV